MNLEELLKLKNFQTWLDEQEPETCIGLPSTKDSCPLATYIKLKTGETYYVKSKSIWKPERMSDDGNFVTGLPPWAREFVRAVDNTVQFPYEVTAATAKQIIEALLRSEARFLFGDDA